MEKLASFKEVEYYPYLHVSPLVEGPMLRRLRKLLERFRVPGLILA